MSSRRAPAASASSKGSSEELPATSWGHRGARALTKRPLLVVGVLGLLALVILAVLFAGASEAQQDTLTVEVGKALTQFLVVVALGAGVKFLMDRYQDTQQEHELRRQEREAEAARDRSFRQDIYQRLVQATNTLRRVPIMVEANRSTKTWSEQMLAVIDVGLDLRMIKHQIYSGRDLPAPPFAEHRKLTYLFETMYHYTDWLAADFGDHKKDIGEFQRRAEHETLPLEERAAMQDEVWRQISGLPTMADMLETERAERAGDGEVVARLGARRLSVRKQLDSALDGLDGGTQQPSHQAPPPPSWLSYQEAEALALELITRESSSQGAVP